MHILPMLLFSLLGGEQIVDDFRYADAARAQAAWIAAEGTTPVEVVEAGGRPIMRLDRAICRAIETAAGRRRSPRIARPDGCPANLCSKYPSTTQGPSAL